MPFDRNSEYVQNLLGEIIITGLSNGSLDVLAKALTEAEKAGEAYGATQVAKTIKKPAVEAPKAPVSDSTS